MNTATTKYERRPFLADIVELRRRARELMEQGAATSGYKADRRKVIQILNDVPLHSGEGIYSLFNSAMHNPVLYETAQR